MYSDKEFKEIIKLLEELALHVHPLDDLRDADLKLSIPAAILYDPYYTHYIMWEDRIVHIGNLKTIPSFLHQFKESENKNEMGYKIPDNIYTDKETRNDKRSIN